MADWSIYEDIALRTGGDIYLGVVGPVRTGKSTFIKRFMETLVIPNIEDVYMRERARDELPQSGSGRTVMTAEPKFVPEEAVGLTLGGGVALRVRLIDCVGYMVPGAAGQFEGGAERMVTTPWFEHEVTMSEAAEEGTRKVITEHSTTGLLVTTDGSVTDIPRRDYVEAEERVVAELRAMGRPFAILLNCAQPDSAEARELAEELAEKYAVTVTRANCLALTEETLAGIMRSILYEFPAEELSVRLPMWVDALPAGCELKKTLYSMILGSAADMRSLSDLERVVSKIDACEGISRAELVRVEPGAGRAAAVIELPREAYYETVSEQCGFEIHSDGELMSLLTELGALRREYGRVSDAMREVRENGYGVVMPLKEELRLEEPQIVRQGGRYAVKLKASAPAIHMIMTDIATEVSPALGGERASEEVINFLLQGYEGDVSRLWESNIFGKSLYDIAGEGLTAKILGLPESARVKLQDTMSRIINEGSGGLICIIL